MRWRTCDLWQAGIVMPGMLLLLLMVWVPLSGASAHEETSGLATPGTVTVQATPTEDATVTALNKEKLILEVKQLEEQNAPDLFGWLQTNAAVLLSTLVVVVGGLIGFFRWLEDRRDAQDKDLKAQTEERFKTAVTALGEEKEGIQVGGAILLRSFLNTADTKSYERYYTQVFDLAVAYLRLSRAPLPSEDPDGISRSPKDPHISVPLSTLRQALIMVFKEVFPRTRDRVKEQDLHTQFHPESLDATSIQLDNAFLWKADLKQVWMPLASLRKADLRGANLTEAKLTEADLRGANFRGANLKQADLSQADLRGADFSGADLREVNLGQAHLMGTILTGADLRGFGGVSLIPDDVLDTQLIQRYIDLNPDEPVPSDLQGEVARYMNKVTLAFIELCKEKGAIIAPNTDAYVPDISPRSSDVQASSAPSLQESIPIPDTDGGSTASSQHSSES